MRAKRESDEDLSRDELAEKYWAVSQTFAHRAAKKMVNRTSRTVGVVDVEQAGSDGLLRALKAYTRGNFAPLLTRLVYWALVDQIRYAVGRRKADKQVVFRADDILSLGFGEGAEGSRYGGIEVLAPKYATIDCSIMHPDVRAWSDWTVSACQDLFEMKLSPKLARVLKLMYKFDGVQADVAKATGLSCSRISQMVKKIRKRGLVEGVV